MTVGFQQVLANRVPQSKVTSGISHTIIAGTVLATIHSNSRLPPMKQ